MFRRSRLRLVALGCACILLASCGLMEAPKNSDKESAPYGEILAARELLSKGNIAEARGRFETLLQAHPHSLQASRGLQDVHRQELEEEEYLLLYEKQAEKTPLSSQAIYLRGRSRIESPGEAADDFRRALELDKGNSWAVAGLAFLAYQQGDLFGAVQTYEEAISAAPHSAQLRLLLGNQYLELRLYVDAQRQLRTAKALAPDDLEVLAALGKVQLALGEEQTALENLEKVRRVEPRIDHIAPSLAAIYLRRGNSQLAEKVYREGLALGLAPDAELAAEIEASLALARLNER